LLLLPLADFLYARLQGEQSSQGRRIWDRQIVE